MKGFTIISPSLEKDIEILYIDDAIYLAVQLALKFREETKVFANDKDKSTLVAFIIGSHIQDHQLKPKEEKFLRGKPERE